jgi:uncharacterized protein
VDPKCAKCSQLCCKYVTMKVDAPKTISDFDIMRWWLLHKQVNVFKDADGWYLVFFSDCRYMEGGLCSNHRERPFTCREHSQETCEYGDSLRDTADIYFDGPEELNAYCRKKFKTWDKRYEGLDE